ncbi:ArnT family glycosyltransferase [Argonema galeatum]|uniref:ArnT family glycosyltransferase n=1 Tax=Argonema galeatum TaxID=2942762 RepID=UPI00201366D7|nr:glycosyltransferase family 39 protein [Argonema galeatum]MCL1467883.1 glycosyltransferase family 39 protein [Argonema galeatum A003/A1]
MPILLITVSFVATVAAFWQMGRTTNDCFRSAFLKASILHGIIIAVLTEELSLSKSLTFEFIILGWSLFALLNCGILLIWVYQKQRRIRSDQITQEIWSNFSRQDVSSKMAITAVILVLSICLITALIAAPNNYDSMTYHMPRVMHWIQNRSVAHYPTNNLRQIAFPPGAAYIVTHLQILSGGDRFANLVQWFAFLGSVLGTSLIAKTFGGSQSQTMTALVCASIPMAIMQSTTPQTDLAVSFWLVCFVYFIFRTANYSKFDFFWLSASLGLAILTKPTAIIFGASLLMILGFRLLGRFSGFRHYLKTFIVTATITVMSITLSIPSYWRNYQTFNDFLGDDFGTRNETHGMVQLISNILRNLAMNLPIAGFWEFVEIIHENFLKIDVNEPAITFNGLIFAPIYTWLMLTPNEDFVGNPVHLILGLIATGVLAIYTISRKERDLAKVLSLASAIIVGFLLFCLLLKWQIWANRLLLPVFILGAPVTGYFMSSYLSKAMQRTLVCLLAVMAIFYSLTSVYHPLIPLPTSWTNVNQSESILVSERKNLYFRGNVKQMEEYTKFARQANQNKCSSVGLSLGKDGLEYPLWVIMESESLQPFKIKHINVKNQSQDLPPEFLDAELCATFKNR